MSDPHRPLSDSAPQRSDLEVEVLSEPRRIRLFLQLQAVFDLSQGQDSGLFLGRLPPASRVFF